MRPFTDLITIDDARQRLAAHVSPITRTERLPLLAAAGRVAAADVSSPLAVPPFARSAMDGYAVKAADTVGASAATVVRLRIIGRVYTGQVPDQLVTAGTAYEIATGAPLPEGADAVVPVEETQRAGDDVLVAASVAAGQHIGRRGADISPGDLVVRAGDYLNASRIGAAAAIGCTEIEIGRAHV